MKAYTWVQISRLLLCILITGLFTLHITHWADISVLKRLDNIAYDLRLKATTIDTIDPRIVILDIDEKSLANEGRWPWSRNKLSELVDILFDHYQIKLLAFDVTFPEQDNSSGLQLFEKLAVDELKNDMHYLSALNKLRPQLQYDDLFSQSLKNKNIVLGYFTSFANISIKENTSLPPSINAITPYSFTQSLIHANSYGANLSILQQATQQGGFFNNPLVDDDGSYRRLPLLTVYNKQLYEALSLAIFRALLKNEKIQFTTSNDYDTSEHTKLEAIKLGGFSFPVDEKSAILVPYRGKQGSFKYISVTDALSFTTEESELKNKIVILGSSAAGILDLRSTPVQNIYPGVEVHANIVSGMLDQRIKYRPNFITGIEFIFIVSLGLTGIIFFPKLSAGTLSLLWLFLTIIITGTNFYLWQNLNIDSLLATPLLFVSILFTLQITFSFLLETHNKKYLTSLFGQYIPAELVDNMVNSKQNFSMEAENRELTVLFSDVRGFTSISESLEAHELAELINEVLSPITKIIHQNNGTIDKYMGDAVMAFWGAPIHSATHASDALKTALAITPAMNRLEEEFHARGWPSIKLGVGLNTGTMSVGNMGSEFRIAYTVLGDAVNLGARLEGLTKQYGVNVIVSESTKNAATKFIYKELDKVQVKGKQVPIRIYEPLGLPADLSAQELHNLAIHTQAIEYYQQQLWLESKELFVALQQQSPEQLINNIYLKRIAEFIQNPPEKSWDGTYTHTSK